MIQEQDNLNFWQEQAKKYQDNIGAVNFDKNGEELELFYLKKLLQNRETICDLGCGNGNTIFHMIKSGIKSEFHGIDITKGMIDIAIEQANSKNLKNVFFYNYSATSREISEKFSNKFETVISKRLLINIKGEQKKEAIKNIYNILKNNGTYIMIENFIEPLNKINEIRFTLQLDEIKVHPFNEYLDLEFIETLKQYFTIEKVIDFQSLYYFTSRIFNAAISDGTPQYDSKLNQIAVEISKNFNDINFNGYSPEIIYILKKI